MYLYDIFEGHVHLQVVFAVGLETTVGEVVVVRGREKIQRVLGRHGNTTVVDEAQERCKCLTRGDCFSNRNLKNICINLPYYALNTFYLKEIMDCTH